jgi:glycosyltransferase involved in cell wall biosynthesis
MTSTVACQTIRAASELVKKIHNFGLGPVHRANEFTPDNSIAINNIGLRVFESAVQAATLLVWIPHRQKINLVVFQEFVVRVRVHIDAHPDHAYPLVPEPLLKLHERRHFFHARRAPCSPKIEYQGSAPKIAQFNLAVRILDSEIRRGSADPGRPGAAVAAAQKNEGKENSRPSHKAIINHSLVPTAEALPQRPTVSVIVPARNEEACLGTCLASLLGQAGVAFEIILVDDASTDRTREIAQSFPGVRVIAAPSLPTGWTGKNNALVAGAEKARGHWLLFTDADTTHLPGSLAGAVAEAQKHGSALLSYSPEQEVHSFWEKAIMPVVFAELAVTFRPSLVSNPRSSAAAANGQYLLISREAYDAIGGHGALASNLLEDVALARAVKAAGRKIYFRYGGDAVRTRMYRSFSQLIEGWTKNLALLFPNPRLLALLRMTEFLLITGSCAIAISSAAAGRRAPTIAGVILALVVVGIFVKRIHRAHFSWEEDTLSIFGLPIFSYLLWRSYNAHKKGIVTWKGRQYTPGFQKRHETRRGSHSRLSARSL